MTLALTFVRLDGLRLCLQSQPNAIALHHGRNFTHRLTMGELSQRLDPIDFARSFRWETHRKGAQLQFAQVSHRDKRRSV